MMEANRQFRFFLTLYQFNKEGKYLLGKYRRHHGATANTLGVSPIFWKKCFCKAH
jgi:hypothetical protein